MTDTNQPQTWQKRIERLEWRPDPGIVGTALKQVDRPQPKAMLQVGLGTFDLPEWLIDVIIADHAAATRLANALAAGAALEAALEAGLKLVYNPPAGYWMKASSEWMAIGRAALTTWRERAKEEQ